MSLRYIRKLPTPTATTWTGCSASGKRFETSFRGVKSQAVAIELESCTTVRRQRPCKDLLDREGIQLDTLRIRAYPLGFEVQKFIDDHSIVFLVEQNRDAQMKSLVVNDLKVNPDQVQSVLYYGGMSISADFIVSEILAYYEQNKLPLLKEVSS